MKKLYAVLLSVCLAGIAGCGGSDEETATITTPEGERIRVTQGAGGDRVTVEGENVAVEASQSGVDLPQDFPADVPIYEPSTITFVAREGDQTIAQLTTPDAIAEVSEFYEAGLPEHGWSIRETMRSGQARLLLGDKDGRECGVQIMQADRTLIILTVGDRAE